MADTNGSDVVTSTATKVMEKEITESRLRGTVKWFNVKKGYGFIARSDEGKDLFVHQTSISADNKQKKRRSLADNEDVEFDVGKGPKGPEAVNVTGPDGGLLIGSQYVRRNTKYNRNSPGGYYRQQNRQYNQRDERPLQKPFYEFNNGYGRPAPPPDMFFRRGPPRRFPVYNNDYYYRGPPMGGDMGPPMGRYPDYPPPNTYRGQFPGRYGGHPMQNPGYSPRERGDSFGPGNGRRGGGRRRRTNNKQMERVDQLADGLSKMGVNNEANNQPMSANA